MYIRLVFLYKKTINLFIQKKPNRKHAETAFKVPGEHKVADYVRTGVERVTTGHRYAPVSGVVDLPRRTNVLGWPLRPHGALVPLRKTFSRRFFNWNVIRCI